MPAAAIGAGIGGAGSIASGIGGKKAQNQANKLAGQELGLQQGQIASGNAALAPASNYWQSLLHGGQAAVQATGPIASQIGQAAQGARNSIQAMTPRGGEQNLALAENYNQASNNIARLYAGMQPLAASQLAGIGGEYFGSAPNPTMAGLGAAGMGMQNAQAGGAGFGSLLYNSLKKLGQGGGGGGGFQWDPQMLA
jgi:hypothetical protein